MFFTKVQMLYLIKFSDNIRRRQNIELPNRLSYNDADVFKDIFFERIYAAGFPFYKNSTIIDIGAHKGYFSLFAAKYAGPGSKIFAIEPEATNYRQLVKNINCNSFTNILPYQCAISDSCGKKQLYLSESVNHSLVKVNKEHPYIRQNGSVDVDTFTLEDFITDNNLSHVNFLKVDCEGSEYDILFNTNDETFNKIDTIALEAHDISDPVKNIFTLSNFLYSRGYKQISTHFQKTPVPLNMGIFIVTRN